MKLQDTSKIENKIRNTLINARIKNYDILKNLPDSEKFLINIGKNLNYLLSQIFNVGRRFCRY